MSINDSGSIITADSSGCASQELLVSKRLNEFTFQLGFVPIIRRDVVSVAPVRTCMNPASFKFDVENLRPLSGWIMICPPGRSTAKELCRLVSSKDSWSLEIKTSLNLSGWNMSNFDPAFTQQQTGKFVVACDEHGSILSVIIRHLFSSNDCPRYPDSLRRHPLNQSFFFLMPLFVPKTFAAKASMATKAKAESARLAAFFRPNTLAKSRIIFGEHGLRDSRRNPFARHRDPPRPPSAPSVESVC
mmetsp:Transcript_31887/g.51782  ORF Transcript_31887/g.51782 Transcript_31887/m.51782 type:complete len:245 (-) Transcript_31887:12-746(-)